MEEWRDVPGYEGLYQVSSLGQIKSLVRRAEKILSCRKNEWGYLETPPLAGSRKMYRVHRLVALTFIPNPDNKLEVDHINRIPDDNRVENLRWANRSEQQVNTKDREHTTEYRNITCCYRVKIDRGDFHYAKRFKTLEEAIEARDTVLASLK